MDNPPPAAANHEPADVPADINTEPDAPANDIDPTGNPASGDPGSGCGGGLGGTGARTTAAELAAWEGLPADAVFLGCELDTAPPMRMPAGVWGLTVLTVDVGGDGQVGLFAGAWEPARRAAAAVDGDVVIRLHPPGAADGGPLAEPGPASGDVPDRGTDPGDQRDGAAVEVELLIAYDGGWRPAGRWPGADISWPAQVAPAAAMLMRLHTDLVETAAGPPAASPPRPAPSPAWPPAAVRLPVPAQTPSPASGPVPPAPVGWGALRPLLEAGLLQPGEPLYWPRRHKGELHTAAVTPDGYVQLADGSRHPNPSGALTALGCPNTSGWKLWLLARDNRPLAALREAYRAAAAAALATPQP